MAAFWCFLGLSVLRWYAPRQHCKEYLRTLAVAQLSWLSSIPSRSRFLSSSARLHTKSSGGVAGYSSEARPHRAFHVNFWPCWFVFAGLFLFTTSWRKTIWPPCSWYGRLPTHAARMLGEKRTLLLQPSVSMNLLSLVEMWASMDLCMLKLCLRSSLSFLLSAFCFRACKWMLFHFARSPETATAKQNKIHVFVFISSSLFCLFQKPNRPHIT